MARQQWKKIGFGVLLLVALSYGKMSFAQKAIQPKAATASSPSTLQPQPAPTKSISPLNKTAAVKPTAATNSVRVLKDCVNNPKSIDPLCKDLKSGFKPVDAVKSIFVLPALKGPAANRVTDSLKAGKDIVAIGKFSKANTNTFSPGIGTSVRGLGSAGACPQPHYLLGHDIAGDPAYNRFEWWDRAPPPTGAFVSNFECEFSPALATVVGGDTSTDSMADLNRQGFHTIAWTAQDEGKQLHQIPAIPFHVRTNRPESVPTLRIYNPAQRNDAPVVLINETEAGQNLQLAAGEFRPALWIDFVTPQRAVGIEYGYKILNNTADFFDKRGVRLTAYDRDNRAIAVAYGREDLGSLASSRRLVPAQLDHTIGVRDRNGRISSVKLEFTTDRADLPEGQEGSKVLEPQVVSRVWFEPLPPAAVNQGVVGFEIRSPGDVERPDVIRVPEFQQTYGQALGPITVNLPYRFDRAVVFMRGFRLESMDFQPYPLTEFKAAVTQNDTRFDLQENISTGGVVTLNPRSVTITPDVSFKSDENNPKPFRGVVYYTLLGWDSKQVTLQTSSGERHSNSIEPLSSATMTLQDYCGIYLPQDEDRNNALCGPLFGGVSEFLFDLQTPTDIEEFYLWPGFQRGFGQPVAPSGNGSLARYPGSSIGWTTTFYFDGTDHDSYHGHWSGTVLTGKSLALGPEDFPGRPPGISDSAFLTGAIPLAIPNVGPRQRRDDYIFDADTIRNDWQLSWPVVGDAAFVGLNIFQFRPGGEPVQQLDFEAMGAAYDGRILDWKMGMGINTLPPITNGNRKRSVFGIPVFGAVKRNTDVAEPQLSASPIFIRDALAGCANPSRWNAGTLDNRGDGAALITGVNKGNTTEDDYFTYHFIWRGTRMDLAEMQSRLPLQLRQGESLFISAEYRPPGLAGRPNPAGRTHHSTVNFNTGSPAYPQVVLNAQGTTVAGTPQAHWAPTGAEGLNFALVPPGHNEVKFAGLLSDGDMGLCVNRLYFADPNKGFYFEYAPLIEPDVLGLRVGCDNTQSTTVNLHCTGSTTLVAETNAGVLSLPVSANVAIPQPTATPDVPPCTSEADVFHGCR